MTSSEPAPAADPFADLVAAHFQRVEAAMLGRVLISTLGGALPPAMVQVEQRRSIWRRLARRPGPAIGVTVTAGERRLTLRAPAVGALEASVGHTVRGVVLSTTPVTVPEWIAELGAVLDRATQHDAATRQALEHALLPKDLADGA